MFVAAAALGLVAGLVRRGDLRRLGALRLRWFWPILAAFAAPIILQRLAQWGVSVAPVAPALYVISLGVLLASCALNRAVPGVPLVMGGIALNTLVIVVNGGRMPVDGDLLATLQTPAAQTALVELQSGRALTHAPMAADTRLSWLGDRLLLSWPGPSLFSLGDLMICLGLALVIALAMGDRSPLRKCPSSDAP